MYLEAARYAQKTKAKLEEYRHLHKDWNTQETEDLYQRALVVDLAAEIKADQAHARLCRFQAQFGLDSDDEEETRL